ncbi:unnamed protein product [Ectocarpus sp. 12 AP-2014]
MSAYFNYKGFYSVVLLALVDNAGFFRWIISGPRGSSDNAGVRDWSRQSKDIAEEQKLPEAQRRRMCRNRFILGDSAFTNSSWLLTPYDNPVTRMQIFFNCKHSKTRFIVEYAFGRLKGKFMVWKNRMYFKIDRVPQIIQACVLLYNFILFHEGMGRDEIFVDALRTKRARGARSNVAAEQASAAARDRKAKYLADNFLAASPRSTKLAWRRRLATVRSQRMRRGRAKKRLGPTRTRPLPE